VWAPICRVVVFSRRQQLPSYKDVAHRAVVDSVIRRWFSFMSLGGCSVSLPS
jgi:hypothetical protein